MTPRAIFSGAIEIIPPTDAVAALALYNEACSALVTLKAIDDAGKVIKQAAAIQLYARIAENKQLEIDAGELTLRAQYRLGELLIASERARGGKPYQGVVTRTIAEQVAPTLRELGVSRKLSATSQRLAGLGPERFEQAIGAWVDGAHKTTGRVAAKLATGETKRERRDTIERELAARIKALPDQRFGVIYADPEWRFEPYSRSTGMDRAPENHYPTSTLIELQRREVRRIAAADSVCVLWAVVPMLLEAFCVLDAWGFVSLDRDAATGMLAIDKSEARYVTSGVWQKYKPGTGIGLGYWFRVDHEILLIATRGNPPAPLQGDQYRSVIDQPASRVHSQKPELVAEMIEAFWPNLPKIELNRRGPPRPGWEAWGNQAEEVMQ